MVMLLPVRRLPPKGVLMVACGVFPPLPALGNGAGACFLAGCFSPWAWATAETQSSAANVSRIRGVSFVVMSFRGMAEQEQWILCSVREAARKIRNRTVLLRQRIVGRHVQSQPVAAQTDR